MSDEKQQNLTHGFNIDPGDHHHALSFMESHMNQKQVADMIRQAESGHSAHFMVTRDGHHENFKLEHHDGKLKIHEAHHS